MNMIKQPLRVGVGGPVGSGKTALLEALCKAMRDTAAGGGDQRYLHQRRSAHSHRGWRPEPERIVGVETGGCPHTAIREDASMNLAAVEALSEKFGNLDLIFVESGGDNLSATFSPELADLTIYVIDVAEGKNPAQRRTGDHQIRLHGDQQNRSCTVRGRVSGSDGARYPAHARRTPVELHQPEKRRRPAKYHRLYRRQRHVSAVTLHHPGAEVSGWCIPCPLFSHPLHEALIAPALRCGIRFANSSHA